MSIPRRDPTFTMKDLAKVGDKFLAAGYAYWEAAHKAGIEGAVIWLQDTNGRMVVFTRGEYSQQIVGNIERLGPVKQFGAMQE
jgi:hypothetical protein